MAAERIALPAEVSEPQGPQESNNVQLSPRALAALVLALVTGLSGLGWLAKPGDYVTTREFDLFREQQRESGARVERKLDDVLEQLGAAAAPTPAPPARSRRPARR